MSTAPRSSPSPTPSPSSPDPAKTEKVTEGLDLRASVPTQRVSRERHGVPVDAGQARSSLAVAVDRLLPEVVLVAVVFDRDAVLGIGGVDAGDEPTLVPDLVLEGWHRQAMPAEQLLELRLHRALRHAAARVEALHQRTQDTDPVASLLALPVDELLE